MEIANLFTLVKSCDKYAIPYDFYISKYPVATTKTNKVKVGESIDIYLYRTTWKSAAIYCNHLSRENNLHLAYSVESDGQINSLISVDTITQSSFRLPTPIEWEYAAHGWSGSKKGDYFRIQKEHFMIPFIDYPTTDEQKLFFEQGYSMIEDLIPNSIDIFGMLVYAREWCHPIERYNNSGGSIIKWDEYYTNYNNDIGYQTVTIDSTGEELLAFRVVFPCKQ